MGHGGRGIRNHGGKLAVPFPIYSGDEGGMYRTRTDPSSAIPPEESPRLGNFLAPTKVKKKRKPEGLKGLENPSPYTFTVRVSYLVLSIVATQSGTACYSAS